MMELAFGAGFQPEDKKYLIEVHEEMIREHGVNETHYDHYIAHFDKTLEELSEILPHDKVKEAMTNIRAARVIFERKGCKPGPPLPSSVTGRAAPAAAPAAAAPRPAAAPTAAAGAKPKATMAPLKPAPKK